MTVQGDVTKQAREGRSGVTPVGAAAVYVPGDVRRDADSETAAVAERATPPRGTTRVLLVGPSLAYLGGQAIQAQRLLERLNNDDRLVATFLPVNPRLGGILGELQRVRYVRTVLTSIVYVASLLRAVRHVDVVHAFSASYWSFILAPVPAMLVGRLFGKRVLLNYRSGEADDHLANWIGTTALVKLAHVVITPSDYLVGVFATHGIAAQAIGNFVDEDQVVFRERSRLAPRFLSNRNFEAHYNVAAVLRAFAIIQRAHPDARLVVAGDGPQRSELHALAERLELRNVDFVGPVPPGGMAALYDSADIYLNSPSIDNMPNSVIEAFAAGLPVVSTDAGGIPFIVRHEQNGLLVPVGDHEGLAREALRLLDDEALSASVARAARSECLSRYTWRVVGAQWRRLYRELTSNARETPPIPSAAEAGRLPPDTR